MSKVKKKPFDFKKYKQRHIALEILYSGWDSSGSDAQEDCDTTIEHQLFKALIKSHLVESKEECNFNICERTEDKGESSYGQVVNLNVRSNLTDESDANNLGLFTPEHYYHSEEKVTREAVEELNYVDILNNLLPEEIRIIAWEPVKSDLSTESLTSNESVIETTNSLLNIRNISCTVLVAAIIMLIINVLYLDEKLPSSVNPKDRQASEVKINLEFIENINKRFPNLLSSKKMRIIKTRLSVMKREISVLMLLGRSRDSHCRLDPTFCVGQTIANATQYQFGYIDASDPFIQSDEIEKELKDSLDGSRYTVMIDSLEQLPGSEVMNLFRFIDKDISGDKRRGMLLFVLYTGANLIEEKTDLKEAEMAERILTEKWSPYIPRDSLTSVISRMCGTIVKVF